MVPEKTTQLKRVLYKIEEVNTASSNEIELEQTNLTTLDLKDSCILTKFGAIKIRASYNSSNNFGIKIAKDLAHQLDLSTGDYLEIVQIENFSHLTPISSQNLGDHFFQIEGEELPRVILLSSHAEFEPFTREIATGIHGHLQNLSVPTLRIEIKKQYIEGRQKFDVTISRYDVDLTRKEEAPQTVARKLVNKNLSYRILAKTYFDLLSKYLLLDEPVIVVDIHGIATRSPKSIIHPMIIVGDALSHDERVKTFTKSIERSSRTIMPNLWIVYSSKWGAIEYSLDLVKRTKNIPIIIEIRRDLRDDAESRAKIIELVANSIENLVKKISIAE